MHLQFSPQNNLRKKLDREMTREVSHGVSCGGRIRFFFSSNLQGANQVAKVATHRNGSTFTEIIAFGAFGSFVFFQLLRTVRNFCFSEFFGRFVLLKMAEREKVF
jgi:hypothetical protein